MNFKLWLEKLEILHRKTLEDDYWTKENGVFAKIYDNLHLNPQWLKSFKKENEATTYSMPIKDDKFIHFSTKETIKKIFESSILGEHSVFAISVTFGKWHPKVQYNHISINLPNSLYITDIIEKKNKPNKRMPEFGKEIDAILFKTNDLPNFATPEEVYWDHPINIYNAKILSSREAINILKHTPERLEYPHEVKYSA
jgi:hypothetical protein